LTGACASLVILRAAQPPLDVLTPVGGLPTSITAAFENPRAYVETSTGETLVLDAGSHSVFLIDARRTAARKILQPGAEWGRILRPSAFSLGAHDIFAIADSPGNFDRIQYFATSGARLGGFYPPGRGGARITVGPLTLNGIGAMQFSGQRFLFNAPETGGLVEEVAPDGNPIRSVGVLRSSGTESDRSLQLMLNVGLPVIDPTGGIYFVFQTGVPLFRKYDTDGRLLFERHIEGPEIDARIQSIPTVWPARPAGSAAMPYVPALVQTAAVDPLGRLWISLVDSVTYVYAPDGEKLRTVRFDAAGLLAPTSFFFAVRNRLLITPGCYEFSSR
jgi:hypothetical protein